MPRLEISLLGSFQVTLDGVPVTRFGADTARALLVYLAVDARTPHRREVLAGLLWPEQPETEARRNLSQALFRLREAIGDRDIDPPFVRTTRETIQLNPDGDCWLDVDAFSQAIIASKGHGHRRAERLREAAVLYRGDFLAGFSLPSAPFEEWLVVEREHLHRQALEALAALADYHEERGAYEEAIGCARRQVALEPWREGAHQQWMRALALSGQRSAVLAQYEACQHILMTELGVAPSQETTALYERIRDGSSLHPVPVVLTGNLPAHSAPFVGRAKELAALDGLLGDRQVRLVTVVGPGGMGKTRLALEVARQALGQTFAEVWMAALAPVPDDASVPRAVAAALGALEQPGRPLSETIATSLQTRELLLVLDNCEHVVEGVAGLVSLLLSRCPELTVLATSREPLHVPGEHLYGTPPMGLPENGNRVESLLTADAVQLFGQRATAVRPGFEIEGNASLVGEVCRRLDGMPLAIELAAARLRALSLAEVAGRLDDRFRLLTGGSRTAHPRQRTLRNTIAWSVDLLDDAERALFARLSAFAGSFDLVSAGDVCGGAEVPAEEVLDRLTSLVDKSLVTVVRREDSETRYRLLETVRAYARERLAARGEVDEIAARHTGCYLALAEGLEPQLWAHEKEMLSTFARLDAEADNLAAAMRWSLSSGEPEIALRIGGALRWWLCMRLQHLHPYAEWLERALAQRGTGDPGCRARAMGPIWRSAQYQNNYEKRASVAEEALALARKTGDPKLIGRAAFDMAISVYVDQPERARTLLQETLQVGRAHGEPLLVCYAWEGLAFMERDPSKRCALLEALLAQEPYCAQFWPFMNLADASYALGDLARAEAWRQRALERAIELGALHLQATQLHVLGWIAKDRGDYDRAMVLLGRCQPPLRRIGATYGLTDVSFSMGVIARCRGDLAQATRHAERTLDLSRQYGDSYHAGRAQGILALVACEQGAYDRAEALCAAALDDVSGWDVYGQGLAASALALVALCRGDALRAIDLCREALDHMEGFGYRSNIVEAVESLAWALAADGQAGDAARLLACAARERDEMGVVLFPVDRPYHDRAVEAACAALGEGTFAAAWVQGEELDLDEAITLADPSGLCKADR